MSLFRRPGESSSESSSEASTSSEDESEDEEALTNHSHPSSDSNNASIDEALTITAAELTRTETLSTGDFSSTADNSNDGVGGGEAGTYPGGGTNSNTTGITGTNANSSASIPEVTQHRNLLLAALLEEFYKTRAAELMNEMHLNTNQRSVQQQQQPLFTRHSPEIQDFARAMFTQMSSNMAGAGLLQAESLLDEQRGLRSAYVTGLNQIGLQDLNLDFLGGRRGSEQLVDLVGSEGRRLSSASAATNPGTANTTTGVESNMALVRAGSRQPVPFQGSVRGQFDQLAYESRSLSMVPRPGTDLRLYSHSSFSHHHSHYRSTFQEKSLLGRGGFGRVYHTYNVFDNCEYAVKKIPLSPRLSQKYRTGGHSELAHMLREVQALAKLDHCNVVRYHATWLEEPSNDLKHQPPSFQLPSFNGQRLLEHRPVKSNSSSLNHGRVIRIDSQEFDNDEDPFDRDDAENGPGPQWSFRADSENHVSTSAFQESDIFSDGNHNNAHQSRENSIDDPSVYVLHVQMSMYPMTLAQYIAPTHLPKSKQSRNNSTVPSKYHHCFHLIPTLRILLGILAGLQYVHSRGMLHRDIKPSNIFLTSIDYTSPGARAEGFADVGRCNACRVDNERSVNPRIGDFGLVTDLERAAADGRRASSGHSRSSSDNGSAKMVGTEYYRPPQPPIASIAAKEQASHKKIRSHPNNEALDVFALGVILVELLCPCNTRMERIEILQECQQGRAPQCLKERLLQQEPCSRDIIDRVESCVHGMIDIDPRRRWTCAVVRDVVEEILAKYGQV